MEGIAARAGTGQNDGIDYEYVYSAYLSLRLLKNENVSNFEFASNIDHCGALDDLIITIELKSGESHHFKIQLKHISNKKLYTRDLEGPLVVKKADQNNTIRHKNDFKLQKYINSYESIKTQAAQNENNKKLFDKSHFILFTTAGTPSDECLKFETFHMEPSENCPGRLFFNTVSHKTSVYKFKVKTGYEDDEDMPIYVEFFKKFSLYVNQRKRDEIMRNIEDIFENDYHNNNEHTLLKFLDFFKKWHSSKKFESLVINREIIKVQLLNLLLEPHFIQPLIKSSNISDNKTILLERAIRRFHLTIIDTKNFNFLNEKWQIHFDEINKMDILNLGKQKMLLSKTFEISDLDQNLEWNILQLTGKYPTIVKITMENHKTIKSVFDIFFRDEITNHKFILIGANAAELAKSCLPYRRCEQFQIFQNIKDLEKNETILDHFTVSIQGRPEISISSLLKISEEFRELVTVKTLFLLLDKNQPLIIGGNGEILPEYYVKRKVPKPLYNIKTLAQIEKDIIIVNCVGHIKRITELIQCTLPGLGIMTDADLREQLEHSRTSSSTYGDNIRISKRYKRKKLDNFILLDQEDEKFIHDIRQKTKDNIHIFELSKFDECEHVTTINSYKVIKEIPIKNFKFINESEMFRSFPSRVNIVSARAGMGKSVMLKYLKNTCPNIHWTVKINLKQYHDFLAKEDEFNQEYILNRLLSNEEKSLTNDFSKKLFSVFKNTKKITFFFDQLDELDRKSIDQVLKKIEQLKEIDLWIFIRPDLQHNLESYFDTSSISIQEFNEEEQTKFLSNRLKNAKRGKEETEEIIEGVFNNFKMVVNGEILGTPLQLYIITEILITKRKYKELIEKIFVLTDMYELFMEGKYDHFLENNSTTTAADKDGIKGLIRDSKIYRFSQYKLAALHSCFNPEILTINFKKSHINCDKFSKDVKDHGDYLGIIEQVNEDNTISFIHQTYAEFFAAQWLAENFGKVQNLGSFIFDERYMGIRFMFDMICCKNQKAHMDVLYGDYASLTQLKLEQINVEDICGRNPLHIGCSWGTPHNLVDVKTAPHKISTMKKKNPRYAEIIAFLVKWLNPKTKDKLYQLDSIKYADRALSLDALEAMVTDERKIKFKSLQNFKDLGSVAYYCVQFNYPKLFHNLPKVPQSSKILQLAIENDRAQLANEVLVKSRKSRKVINERNLLQKALSAEMVDILIEKGADVHHTNEWGESPIEISIYSGNLDTVTRLKEKTDKKFLKEIRNRLKQDLVLSFVEIGNFRVVRNLIEVEGIELNKPDSLNDTALHLAVKYSRNSPVVKCLLHAGARVNVQDDFGNTPLIIASFKSNARIVKYLIESGAHLKKRNKIKNNALIVAVDNFLKHAAKKPITTDTLGRYRDSKLNQFIKSNNNNGNSNNKKNIKDKYNDLAAVKFLVENGADVNAVDDVEQLPLLSAIFSKKYNVIKFLLENGANPNCENTMGVTIFEDLEKNTEYADVLQKVIHLMSQLNYVESNTDLNLSKLDRIVHDRKAHSKEKFDTIKHIVEADKTPSKKVVNEFGNENRSVLSYAIEYNHFELVQFLIENGADPENVNINGNSAIMFPRIDQKILDYILDRYPKIVNKPNTHEETPLSLAVSRDDLELVSYLLAKGADPNVRDEEDNTPVLKATELGFKDIVEFLLKVPEVKRDITDNNGRTLLEKAVQYNHFHLVQFLVENEANAHRNNFILHGALAHKEILNYLIQKEIITDDHFKNYMETDQIDGALLCRAVQNGNLTLVKYLVENGANVDEIYERRTSLGHAASYKNIEIASFLYSKGASVELARTEISRAAQWDEEFLFILSGRTDEDDAESSV